MTRAAPKPYASVGDLPWAYAKNPQMVATLAERDDLRARLAAAEKEAQLATDTVANAMAVERDAAHEIARVQDEKAHRWLRESNELRARVAELEVKELAQRGMINFHQKTVEKLDAERDAALAREAMLREALELTEEALDIHVMADAACGFSVDDGDQHALSVARAALSASPSDWLAARDLRVAEAVRDACGRIAPDGEVDYPRLDLAALLKGMEP